MLYSKSQHNMMLDILENSEIKFRANLASTCVVLQTVFVFSITLEISSKFGIPNTPEKMGINK